MTVADKFGSKALNSVAGHGHLKVVKPLLDKSANMTTADKYRWIPLNIATNNIHFNVVRVLSFLERFDIHNANFKLDKHKSGKHSKKQIIQERRPDF